MVLLALMVLPAQALSGAGWHYENAVLTITGDGLPELGGMEPAVAEIVIEEGVTAIADRAFCGMDSLTKVTFPGTLTGIGREAFMDCRALTEVVIPESVGFIGCGAFRGCTGLEVIVLEGGSSIIGECPECGEACAFSGCTADVFYSADSIVTAASCTQHTPVSIPGVEPTCNTEGLSAGSQCSVCGEMLVEPQILPATGHTSKIIPAIAPSCTASGLSEGEVCVTCGETIKEQVVIPALGHTPSDNQTLVQAPTCAQTGLMSATCTTCHSAITMVVPALQHEWEGPYSIEPDCVTEGSVFYYCPNCSTQNVIESTPALGHTGMTISGFEPTCYENGLTEGVQCIDCGEMLVEPQVIPATGHTPGEEYIAYTAPTCTLEGSCVFVCTVCYQDCYEVLPATGHKWTLTKEVKPTCTTAGENTYQCQYCSMVKTEAGAAALGHAWEGPFTAAPTCTASGSTYNACANCELQEVLSTIPATGHTSVVAPAVAPTCTSSGLTEGRKCSVCGKVLTAQKTVPATGHTVAVDQYVCETVLGGDAELSLRFLCGDSSAITWTAQDTAKLKLTSASHKNGVSMATFDANGAGITTVVANFADGITMPEFFTVITHSDQQLILPDQLKTIEAEAFRGSSVQEVVLPGTLTTIGANAFADCADLALVYMPDSVSSIAGNAFANCSKVSFLCQSRNTAAIYASEYGIPYIIVG